MQWPLYLQKVKNNEQQNDDSYRKPYKITSITGAKINMKRNNNTITEIQSRENDEQRFSTYHINDVIHIVRNPFK